MKRTAFIWEKTVYLRGVEGWEKVALAKTENLPSILVEASKKGDSFQIVYDPYLVNTDVTDCPKGPREVMQNSFAETHEAIANELTAWGYQPEWPIGGGAFSTFVSYETTPVLRSVLDKLAFEKRSVKGVYPLASLVTQAGMLPGRTTVFMIVDQEQQQAYMAVALISGMRAVRKFFGEKDHPIDLWGEIQLFLADFGIIFDFQGQTSPQITIYEAPGTDVSVNCPFWVEMDKACSVARKTFDDLEKLLLTIPRKHTSLMTAGFPQNISLNPVFGGLTVLALLGLAFVGYMIYDENTSFTETKRDLDNKKNLYLSQKTQLQQNKTEIEEIQRLFSENKIKSSEAKYKFMQGFSEGLPTEYTVTALRVFPENTFQIEGIIWNLSSKVSKDSVANPIISALGRSVPGAVIDPKKTSLKNPEKGELNIEGTLTLQ